MTANTDAQNPGRTVTTEMTVRYPEMTGRVAVVTGAARGMGAQFVRGLATRGVHVVGGDIDDVQMKETAEQITTALAGGSLAEEPGTVIGSGIDVTKAGEHETLAQRALTEFGRIDYWINNAGIFPFAHIADITAEQIDATLDVNVKGPGPGRESAVRALNNAGFKITSITDVTPIPHNGCRPPKKRRV